MTPRALYPGLPIALATVSGQLQATLGTQVEKYVDRLSRSSRRHSAKIIHDPVWRTIRVEPWEVIIIDSPLLQRLRRVHQLGLAGYVFPGANYSRFEHSIGVLHQAQRVIDSIRRNARSLAARTRLPQEEPISLSDEALLRATALTDDVGHGFLSHVSERALAGLKTVDGTHTVRKLQEEAKSFFGALNPPAVGEILSGLCILLPEWQEVLAIAQVPHWSDALNLSFRIAQLICGGRDPKRPFLSEIISGPLDVDKLDYIPRDCYMAGVPMPVDVDRLMEKIQVVSVPAKAIPAREYLEEAAIGEDETVQVLAVQTAGSRAFEELVISRFLLYEKLYYHQKIRAMEGAVVNAIDILATEREDFRKVSTYLQLSDDEFLLQHWPGLPGSSARIDTAKELVSAIVERNPLVRCYAFGPGLVKDLEPDSQEFRSRWKKLVPKVTATRAHVSIEFKKRVADRARASLRQSGQVVLAESLVEDQIVIDLPPVQGIAEKTKFFVGDEQSGVEPFITRFRVERWAEAYETQHTIGYVYTLPEFALAVYFAVRDLIWADHGLSFDDASWTRTKLASDGLHQFSKLLAMQDESHLPFSEPKVILDRRAFVQRNEKKQGIIEKYSDIVHEVVERCKTFESHDGVRISIPAVNSWLLQFQAEEIPLAIRVLGAIRFWGRSALSDALAFAAAWRFSERFQALGLGAPTASAHHLTYLWDDVRDTLGSDLKVVLSPDDMASDVPIVVYDDNIGSGGQAGTIFSQWFGIKNRDTDLDEKHVEPLTPMALEKLKHVPILLVFATGFRSGLERIEERLRSLADNPNVHGLIIDPSDVSCFRPASRVFDETKDADKAKETFMHTGKLALHDRALKSGWSPEKTDSRVLGYGNAGGLTVFHYNVPTTTLAALWGTSRSVNANWTALFPRRPRASYGPKSK